MNESHDPTVLAVAAHDVGQYVKHYERGKKSVSPSPLYVESNGTDHAFFFSSLWCFSDRIFTDLGGKTRVMELMSHENPDVRYQALVTVQRLVSHPWANM